MEISRRALWVIIATAIIIVGFALSLTWNVAKRSALEPQQSATGAGISAEPSKTVLPVPTGVAVPDQNSAVAANVAKPENVVAQAGGFKYRSFDIQVQNNKFTPDTVIVNAGDDVYITFLAIDKDYDFKQPDTGFANKLPKGQKVVLHGQFPAAGKFILYCQSCGGPDKGPLAYIVVVPK